MAKPSFQQYLEGAAQQGLDSNVNTLRDWYVEDFGEDPSVWAGPSRESYLGQAKKMGIEDLDAVEKDYEDQYSRGFWGELWTGLKRGTAGLGATVGTTAKMLGAEDLGGMIEDYWTGRQEINRRAPAAVSDIWEQPGEALTNPDFLAAGIGEIAPSLFPSLGTGAALYRAGAGPLLSALGMGTVAGHLEAAPELREDLAAGETDPYQKYLANLVGVGALNMLPGGAMFSKMSPAAKAIGTGLTEGLTEWAEEPYMAAVGGEDVWEATKRGANVFPFAALMGAGGGMMAGSPDQMLNVPRAPLGTPLEEVAATPRGAWDFDWATAQPVQRDTMEPVTSGTTGVPDETMQPVQASPAERWTAVLPGLSRSQYEEIATETLGADPRAATQGELQSLRERIQKQGETPAEAVRGLWGEKLANAPRELQQTARSDVAMQAVSPETTPETPAFLRKQAGLGSDQKIDPSVTGEMFTKKQETFGIEKAAPLVLPEGYGTEDALEQEPPAYKDAAYIYDNVRDKFLAELPEDADFDEAMEAVENGNFSPEYSNFIRALERDDWLGFDYPSQAISAALSENINDFDPSQALKQSIGRLVNIGVREPATMRLEMDLTPEGYRASDEAENAPLRDNLLADLSDSATLRGASVLMKSINAEAMHTGEINLIGKNINTPEDLATLAQVWRDPRWETMRYVFVKQGKVVGYSGFSQRLPGSATLFGMDKEQGLEWLRTKMTEHGADGYWMLHNHPSGNPAPSDADIRSTNFLSGAVDGLQGHVVIDSNKYASIDKSGGDPVVVDKQFTEGTDWLHPGATGYMADKLEGERINSSSQAAELAKQLKNGDNIQLAGVTGGQGELRAVIELTPSILEDTKLLKETIKGFAQKNGVQSVFVLNAPGTLGPALFNEGYLTDVVTVDGVSQRATDPMANRPVTARFGVPRDMYGLEVAEDTDEYATKYAGNVNTSKFAMPGVPSILRSTYTQNAGKIEAERRGKVSWEETEALAQDLGMTVQDLKKRRKGQSFNAEELDRARALTQRSAEKVVAAGRTGNREAVLKAMAEHVEIQAKYSGAVAEAGRALQILRKQTMELKEVNRIANDVFKGDPDTAMEMIMTFDSVGQVSKFAREVFKPKASDVLLEIWINALLSGPQTHVVNMTSNALVQGFTLVEDALAAAPGAFRKSDRITLRDVLARAQGMVNGATRGAKAGYEAFKTEEPQDATTKIEMDRRAIRAETFKLNPKSAAGKMVNWTGKKVRIPGRLLMAEDEFYKSMVRHGAIAQAATREALSKGFKGKALTEEIARLTASPTDEIMKWASEEARYNTFTNELGSFGQSIQNMVAKVPALRVIIPFIRTPTNILKFAIHRSPLAPIFKPVRDDLLGKNGKIKRDRAWARMVAGTAIGATVAQYALQGLISGGGPDDPTKKAMLRQQGWQPYSVRIGDKWYSYQRLEPFGMLFGVAADYVEIADQIESDEADNVAGLIIGSIAKNMTSKTWLRGMSEAIMVISDPDRYGERWVQRLVGTAIPTGVAQIARTQDPTLREARTIVDTLKARIPGLRETLPPRRDVFGQPITTEGGIGPDILSPVYESSVKADPVAKAVHDLGVTIGKTSRKLMDIELTDEQYDQYAELTGKYTRNALEGLVRHPRFNQLPAWGRKDYMEKAINRARKTARTQFVIQNPSVLYQSTQEKLEEYR